MPSDKKMECWFVKTRIPSFLPRGFFVLQPKTHIFPIEDAMFSILNLIGKDWMEYLRQPAFMFHQILNEILAGNR